MTNKEIVILLEKLLYHYEKVLDELLHANQDDYFEICAKSDTQNGICWCSYEIFITNIYYEDFTESFDFPSPIDFIWRDDNSKIPSAIEYRINKIKELINSHKTT